METAPASGQNTQRTRSGRKGPDHFEWSNKRNEATSFEDMLNKFKQSSDEKMSALKKVWSLNGEDSPSWLRSIQIKSGVFALHFFYPTNG